MNNKNYNDITEEEKAGKVRREWLGIPLFSWILFAIAAFALIVMLVYNLSEGFANFYNRYPAAFLRGAFLAGGSVTDPAKGYHIELTTTHQSVAREGYTLIFEVLGFNPKSAKRGGGQVLYLKQSDLISDFLTYLGAPVAAMGIIEARLEKELNNRVNRRCNCDDANTSKTVEAAQEQLNAIRILQEQGRYNSLPAKLQEAAVARLENPESSLTELAAMMQPPISKPAMNHRLQKLVQKAQEGTQ